MHTNYPKTPLVLLDTGNFSDNPTPEGDIKTRGLLDAMVKLDYAAVNVGESDLKVGYEELIKLTQGLPYPLLSTNIVRNDTKQPVFKPYVVVEAKREGPDSTLRIAVLGIARFNPSFLKAGPEGTNLVIASPAEMLKRYLPEARKGADMVVLLAALHRDDARTIAREVKGIDFILGAYGGVYSTDEESEGNTRILYTGNQGKRIGESRIFVDASKHIANVDSYMHFLIARYPEDDEMNAFLNGVYAKIKEKKRALLETGGTDGQGKPASPFVGTSACKACHVEVHAQWAGTRHARAYATLAGERKEQDPACVSCHTTGAGQPGGFQNMLATPDLAGVGCESCHGPGRKHAIRDARGYGRVQLATCTACHDKKNSPSFDYYAALTGVRHRAQSSP